ncbi:hypothetical protein PX701_18505 [Agromyces sp. H3Y2-19a]|uniref:hypothetical protein n=1 Tax=Agromyces chromiiresistens TaxID=3030835 RepID=UPI0023B9B80A|nr:hypothetical protein [Agromyces chromiiresistens]MDF0515619.1 hypothetical protein [Agromyces chromiiresistens]
MNPTQQPEDELQRQADGLLSALDRLPATSAASKLLDTLSSTQLALAEAYERLAFAHEQSALVDLRAELTDTGIPDNPAWLAADVALRTAGRLARLAAQQLQEALRDNEVAVWFDDLEGDA